MLNSLPCWRQIACTFPFAFRQRTGIGIERPTSVDFPWSTCPPMTIFKLSCGFTLIVLCHSVTRSTHLRLLNGHGYPVPAELQRSRVPYMYPFLRSISMPLPRILRATGPFRHIGRTEFIDDLIDRLRRRPDRRGTGAQPRLR